MSQIKTMKVKQTTHEKLSWYKSFINGNAEIQATVGTYDEVIAFLMHHSRYAQDFRDWSKKKSVSLGNPMFQKKRFIPPVEKHTHFHSEASHLPGVVAPYLSKAGGLLIVFLGISYLAESNGHREPVQAGIYAVLGIALIYVLWPKIETLLDRWAQYKLEIRELSLKYEMTGVQQYTPTIKTPTDERLHRLCQAVLGEAATVLQKGEARPWTRRNAGAVVLRDDGDSPVGETLGGQVRGRFQRLDLIRGKAGKDNINFKNFPTLDSALKELNRP